MSGFGGRILLAVGGSEQARAPEAAAESSASTGSGLHVVFVMPTAAHLYSREMKE